MRRHRIPLLAGLSGLALIALAPIVPAVAPAASTQDAPERVEFRTFFTLQSAQPPDQDVGDAVRAELARLENPGRANPEPVRRALAAVSIDLDGDGHLEMFVPGRPSKAGAGTPWVIVDGARGAVRGAVIGGLVFVARSEAGTWPLLETYGKTTSDTAIVSEYAWSNGKYAKAKAQVLGLSGIEDYFDSRPPLGTELQDFAGFPGDDARAILTKR